jgi:hypothetical protein
VKRIALVGAAVAAILTAAAAPVFAEDASAAGTKHTSLIIGAERFVADTANPILAGLPTPDGWHQRFLCAWNYQTNQQVCLYFPWPA